ncbi:MAG TPA: hypothetical protein VGJ95_00575, partial [Pseudonocardiaceae bacterium]
MARGFFLNAVTAVCFAYFTNLTSDSMQGSAKTAAIIVAGGGLAITMFWQFILTPRRRAALART